MITELMELPALAHVELFAAGVDPDNSASVGCLVAAGFRAKDTRPDWEGIVYYLQNRSAA
jgi:hypothetical protein